uniref:Protein archease n=1 Tax=Labrus bergylta TaxID=56723 RepID=A0A3Q3NG04_9LABR
MDDRELDLTAEQKATKSKYPPINKKYEYLDHTADVQIHSWGSSLEEAFEQCAMGMFGYMTDTETVEPIDTVEVESEGDDMESLLFHFLDDWLYKFCADLFFVPQGSQSCALRQNTLQDSLHWVSLGTSSLTSCVQLENGTKKKKCSSTSERNYPYVSSASSRSKGRTQKCIR